MKSKQKIDAVSLFEHDEELSPTGVVHMCSLISEMNRSGVDAEFLALALRSALLQKNGQILRFLEKWVSTKNEKLKTELEKDVRSLIERKNIISISLQDVADGSDLLRQNIKPFKSALANAIKENIQGGIPALAKQLKINKAALYRFLAEERMPQENKVKAIFERLEVTKLKFKIGRIGETEGVKRDE